MFRKGLTMASTKTFKVTLGGYGPYGDGPCAFEFEIKASSSEEALKLAYSEFSEKDPDCAMWGVYDKEVKEV